MSALGFRLELEKLINRESMENGSDTPDFVLCLYLMDCLRAFDRAVEARERHYGRASGSVKPSTPETSPAPADPDEETPCPKREDGMHCECWYGGNPCCGCGREDILDGRAKPPCSAANR